MTTNLIEKNQSVALHKNEGDLYRLTWVVVDEDSSEYVAQYARVGANIHYRIFGDMSLPTGVTIYVYFTDEWLDEGPAAAQPLASVRVRTPEDAFEISYERQIVVVDGEVGSPDDCPEIMTIDRNGILLSINTDAAPLVTLE